MLRAALCTHTDVEPETPHRSFAGMPTPLTWNGSGLTWNQPGLTWNGNLPENHPMPNPNTDAALSAADAQAIKDAFAAALAKISLAVNLTQDDRKKLTKTGPDSVSYVRDALTGLQTTRA